MKQGKSKIPKSQKDNETTIKIEDERFPTPSLQWNDVIKVVGSVAGFIGLGGALLWLFGRSFYAGLFSAFGFSSLTVSIAPEDYLEQGTTSLVYFFFRFIIHNFSILSGIYF